MPEIELQSLVWLVWGGSLVGLQSSISILLNFKNKTLLPLFGSAYFLSIFCLSFLHCHTSLAFYVAIYILQNYAGRGKREKREEVKDGGRGGWRRTGTEVEEGASTRGWCVGLRKPCPPPSATPPALLSTIRRQLYIYNTNEVLLHLNFDVVV